MEQPVRAIKRINHNAAICVDGAGRQLIALGRGIGFGDLPREVEVADVQRTFYNVDPKYLAFVSEVDPEVLEFAAQLADLAVRELSYELSPNLPITLADHIQFALKRAREHMVMALPLSADVQLAHPVEYKLGELAVRGLKRTFRVRLQKDEAAGIALSIVNAAVSLKPARAEEAATSERLLDQTTRLIERELGISVDRSSFAYARFTTHLLYLIKRMATNEPLESGNSELFDSIASQNPQVTACANRVARILEGRFDKPLTNEEKLYLIMHINRIASAR